MQACKLLWQYNIKTYESGANATNIRGGHAFITIDYDCLSDHNKEIARRFDEPSNVDGFNAITLKVPMTGRTSPTEINDAMLALVEEFEPQPMQSVKKEMRR